MKKYIFILLTIICISCVQKTRKVTVAYYLDVSDVKNIKSVAVRGSDKPLNWENNSLMQPFRNDSLYKFYATYNTGYKFTEVKFVVNDSFEFANGANRRVVFSSKDTTVYNAKFNVVK